MEREIKDLDQQIKDIRRESQSATALTEKLAAQKRLKTAESERNKERRELYDARDAFAGYSLASLKYSRSAVRWSSS